MFTMEKYYAHFISRQTRFVSPLKTFRPSPEKSPETPYQSALMNTQITSENPLDTPVSAANRPAYEGGPTRYEIQEEVTMLELIEELKREERQQKRSDSSP
jgi:hypothetical protein